MVTSLPRFGEVREGMGAVHNRRAQGAPQVFVNATSARDILIVVTVCKFSRWKVVNLDMRLGHGVGSW
jgi:hypothetical protein